MNRFFFHFEKCFTKRLGLIRLYYYGIVLKVQQDEISKVRLDCRTLLKNRNSEMRQWQNFDIFNNFWITFESVNQIGRLMMVSG